MFTPSVAASVTKVTGGCIGDVDGDGDADVIVWADWVVMVVGTAETKRRPRYLQGNEDKHAVAGGAAASSTRSQSADAVGFIA
jgi:hypothetical protein